MEENSLLNESGLGDNPINENVKTDDVEVVTPKRKWYIRLLKVVLIIVAVILFIPASILFFLYVIPGIQELGKGRARFEVNDQEFMSQPAYKKQIAQLDKEFKKVTKKLESFYPVKPYIIISTTNNRFYLYKNKTLLREGFCSSGSYIQLVSSDSAKTWVFQTPKGMFKINSKRVDPIWVKPDWAFVEEGLPIPSARADSRYEYGVLGDYALDIGNDYMIHGTIWKRFLGMPATHGCIRLNDEDLKIVYKTLDFGSKVYIY